MAALKPVALTGKIFTGVLRGTPLLDVYFHRIVGLIGYEPYKGTMNVRLERKIKFELYFTRAIDQILMDGTRKVDALLAPVHLRIRDNEIDCWAIRQPGGVYGEDVIEIVSKRNLKQEFSLKDNDEIGLTFFEQPPKKKPNFILRFFGKLYGREPHLMKT